MQLKLCDPNNFIGRTILYRHQAWLVEKVASQTIHLSRPGLGQSGRITVPQFSECRLYPTREEVLERFPMLLRALRHASLLTQGEAVDAIHGMISSGPYYMGSEAVAHVGGAANAINHAWRRRHNVQRQAAI